VNNVGHAPTDVVTLSSENGGVTTREVSTAEASLESQLIELNSAEQSYKANAKVIQVQKDMDDALLDILT